MDDIEKKVAEINEANGKAIHDFQVENDRKLGEKASQVRLDEVKAEFQKKWDAQEVEIAKLKTGAIKAPEGDKDRPEHKAFGKYLRKGLEALSPDERKVLTIADSTHSGVLARDEYVKEILHYASLQHPMRTLATVRQTNAYQVQVPVETAIGAATWEAESATKTETTGLTHALVTIIPQEIKILYKATQKMLEDSEFNLEAEIASAVGRAFGTLEGTSIYSGNGTTTGCEGISVNATVLADGFPATTDNTMALDDFFKTSYSLASPYIPNASWVMNRTTLGTIVQLKNATTNQYLLQPSLQDGQPLRLMGTPIYEWSDFPAYTSTTLADGVIVAAIADFKRGYYIVDRVGITIQRLNELYAAAGMIGFYARARVGGGVVVPEAIQLYKNITT